MITQDYLEGLGKQIFMLDYIANGLFPCQSDVVRAIRAKKKNWEFGDKFEYRMLLAHTNTGGTLNSQVYKDNVALIKPGKLDFGVYHATYGTITDGFMVDQQVNLETANKKAAFEQDYATLMHSMHMNVAALFKNFCIHGRYGVVHQIRASIEAPNIGAGKNPVPNVHTPVIGTPFTIAVPANVFNSNFKRGKYLIKTKTAQPWGTADVSELYMVLDNQPRELTLIPVGTTVTDWEDGQFLEVQGNREIIGMPQTIFQQWDYGALTVASGPYAGIYDQFIGTGAYTNGANSVTGAMEGLPDLFPWYTDPADMDTRLGLDMPFRDQDNRLIYSVEQAGQWVLQRENEHIIDCILTGVELTRSNVPWADTCIWMNPKTLQRMGYEEGSGVTTIRNNLITGPIMYQRGIEGVEFQVGNSTIKNVIQDMNLPTDVILIGPANDISYNTWDNPVFQIEDFIQETWGKKMPPTIKELKIPNEFVTSLDIGKRITYGSPTLSDGGLASFDKGNGFRHPKNQIPVAFHEMGALFTEYPYTYSVVKLREPIINPTED